MSSIAAHRRRIQRLFPLAIETHLRAIHATAGLPAPPEGALAAIREVFAAGSAPYSDEAVRGILRAGVPLDTMTDDELLAWLVEDLGDEESQAMLAQAVQAAQATAPRVVILIPDEAFRFDPRRANS